METMIVNTKLFEFGKAFPTEKECKKYFKSVRDLNGVTCKKCGCKDHWWKPSREQYVCKKCGFQTTLKSGTVMESSHLSFKVWFIAMYLITSATRSISALDLYKKLKARSYQPIWKMLHKLRNVMGKRDAKYLLNSEVEVDEAFYSTMVDIDDQGKPTKRGAGSQKKTKVLVMAESKTIPNPKDVEKPKQVGYIKMAVIPDLKSDTIAIQASKCIDEHSTIVSDATKSHSQFKNIFNKYISQVIDPKDLSKILPWVHICIGNSKAYIQDFYHGVKKQFLQSYLNEFCYKFNRRYFDKDILYARLAVACAINTSDFKHIDYCKAKSFYVAA